MDQAAGAPAELRFNGTALTFVLAGAFVIAFLVLLVRRGEQQQLVFASWGTVQDKQAYERLIADYNRTNPELPVIFHHVSDPYYEKIMIQTVGNNAPDVFKMDAFRVVDWARRGALLDLTPLARSDPGFSEADFYPQLLENNRHGGRFYGVPVGFSTTVLYYNEDLFDQAGLDYPDESWDWDRFLAAAKKMTLRDDQGRTVQFGCAMDNGLLIYAWQGGGRFYDERAERCVFDSPETVRGLTFCWELLHKHRVSPSFIESSVLKPHTRFTTGHVPMIISGCWGVPRFSKSKDLRWGLTRLPRGPAGPVSGLLNDSLVVSRATRHPEAAWRFIRFLTGREGQVLQARDGNSIPAVRAVAESDAFLHDRTTFPNSNNRIFLDSMAQTYPWPLPPSPRVSLGVAMRILTEEMTLLSQGRQPPAETAAAVERRVNQAIAAEAASERSKPFAGSFVFWGLVLAAGAAAVFGGRAVIGRRRRLGGSRD